MMSLLIILLLFGTCVKQYESIPIDSFTQKSIPIDSLTDRIGLSINSMTPNYGPQNDIFSHSDGLNIDSMTPNYRPRINLPIHRNGINIDSMTPINQQKGDYFDFRPSFDPRNPDDPKIDSMRPYLGLVMKPGVLVFKDKNGNRIQINFANKRISGIKRKITPNDFDKVFWLRQRIY